jgi:ankyrin repeat protein
LDDSLGLFRPCNLEFVSTDPHQVGPGKIINAMDNTEFKLEPVEPVEQAIEPIIGTHFLPAHNPTTLLQEGRKVMLAGLQSELGLTLNGKTGTLPLNIPEVYLTETLALGVLGKFSCGRWQVSFDDDKTDGPKTSINQLINNTKRFNAKNLRFMGSGNSDEPFSILTISGAAYLRYGNGQVGPVAGSMVPEGSMVPGTQPAILIYVTDGMDLADTKIRLEAMGMGDAEGVDKIVDDLIGAGALGTTATARGPASSPLFKATFSGNLEDIKRLHQAQPPAARDIDEIDQLSGMTPLQIAAYEGHLSIAKYYVDLGANLDLTKPDDGCTAIMVAAQNRANNSGSESGSRLGVVSLLLEAGARLDLANRDNETVLDLAASSTSVESESIIELLLKFRPVWEHLRQDSCTGFSSALANAAEHGSAPAATALIGFGMGVGGNKVGWTPLHFAAEHGHVDVVKLLLGAEPDIVHAASNIGEDPLRLAAQAGHIAVVKVLLSHGAKIVKMPDADGDSGSGSTALHVASFNGHALCMKELLKADSALIDITDTSGLAAIHFAATSGHLAVVQELLDSGAQPDLKSHTGRTPLYLSSSGGHLDIVHALCQAGADVNAAGDDGVPPLFIASQVELQNNNPFA